MSELGLTIFSLGFAEDEEACRRFGLPVRPGGYGYVLATAEDKSRFTAVTDDPEFLRMVADSSIEPGEGGIDLPGHKFPWTFQGWPRDWSEPPGKLS